MQNITADEATTLRAFFLPFIEAEHKATRGVFQAIPTDKLNEHPQNIAISISDFVWEIINAEHFFLAGICDGRFPDNAPKASETRIAAILRWDDHCFAYDFRLLAELSGENLVRRLNFLGGNKPVIGLVPLYLSTIASYRGQLIAFLRSLGVHLDLSVNNKKANAREQEGAELSESELAAVIGGTGSTMNVSPTSPYQGCWGAFREAVNEGTNAFSTDCVNTPEPGLESTLLFLQTAI